MVGMTSVQGWLADPGNVARFQRLCGVELIPDTVHTCSSNQRLDMGSCSDRGVGDRNTGRCGDSSATDQDGVSGTSAPILRHTHPTHPTHNNNYHEKKAYNGVGGNGHIKNGKCDGEVSDSMAANQNARKTSENCTNSNDTPIQGGSPNRLCCDDAIGNTSNHATIPNGRVSEGTSVHGTQNGHVSPSNHFHPSAKSNKTATRISIRYRPLYYLAQVGATLGNEEFYLSVLPFMLWAVDAVVIRQTAMVWCLVMYLGQATKDYLRWPRPPSPPVIRLESQHLQEFSMPSTHAMAGTAIPLVLATMLLERYQLPVLPVLIVGVLWCSTTCLSRLYLGVHTILDVVCGILYALGIYFAFSPLMGRYDHYQQTHPLAPLILAATSLALCTVCYPSSHKNSAQGDAVQITSVLVGVGVGAWLNCQLGLSVEMPLQEKIPLTPPTFYWLVTSVLQFVLGVAVVLVVKVVVKFASVRFFSAFFGLDKVDTQNQNVMIGYKYATYLTLGLTISFLNPLLFSLLGIMRPGYYLEIV